MRSTGHLLGIGEQGCPTVVVQRLPFMILHFRYESFNHFDTLRAALSTGLGRAAFFGGECGIITPWPSRLYRSVSSFSTNLPGESGGCFPWSSRSGKCFSEPGA